MKNKYYLRFGQMGYLVVTSNGNFIVTNDAIFRTNMDPWFDAKEVDPDVTIQGMIDNALSNANNILRKGEVEIFQCMVDSDIQDTTEEEK